MEKRRVTRLSLKMVLDGEMTKSEFEQLCIPEIRKVCSFHGDVYAPEVWVEDLELCTMEILPGKILQNSVLRENASKEEDKMKFIKAIMEKLSGRKWKLVKMSKETKGILTILIAEIQDCKNMEEVKSLSDCWVKANDLHPEQVEQLSKEEFGAKYRGNGEKD